MHKKKSGTILTAHKKTLTIFSGQSTLGKGSAGTCDRKLPLLVSSFVLCCPELSNLLFLCSEVDSDVAAAIIFIEELQAFIDKAVGTVFRTDENYT